MPTGIVIPERIILDIGVSIERKYIPRAGDDGIGLDKAAQRCVVESRVVKVQSYLGFGALAGVEVVRGVCAGGNSAGAGSGFAESGIACFACEAAICVGGDAGGAKVVAQKPG